MRAMPGLEPGPHVELLREALDAETGGQRALMAGDRELATTMLAAAARRYIASFDCAPPASYGRLIGGLKAGVLAGDAARVAEEALARLEGAATSPPARYAAAIAHLVRGEDPEAGAAAAGMRNGDGPFERAADAIAALARRDRQAYAAACHAIVADFASREEHLTGVPIADTAAMLEVFADARGMACRPASPVMPPPA